MVTKTPKKTPNIFYCEKCEFRCFKNIEWDRHLMTRKHQMVTNGNTMVTKKTPTLFTCVCGNVYAHKSGFSRHKKTCEWREKTPDQTPSDNKLVDTLVNTIKEQQGMINQLIQTVQTVPIGGGNNTNHSHNTTHTNSHNKTFNLQFFLNETCKDAMNITDFVNSLKLTLQDLEKVGELGYAEGISRMVVRGLNDLDVTKRPIHCSDLKREIIHIKDQDRWEKDENKEKLTKAIKDISTKNLMLMSDWRDENPGCTEYNHGKNDMYLKLMTNSVGPLDEKGEKRDFGKIMRSVAKNTIIDRESH